MFPSLALRSNSPPGVQLKDYIVQSGEFLICAFALTHLAITRWRSDRRAQALALALFALVFLANIVFVATGRSTLVIFMVLLPVLAFQRFRWRGVLAIIGAGIILAGVAWTSSPYLRERVLAVAEEIQQYRNENAGNSSGYRLEFWKKSVRFIVAAPVFGHGTGSVIELFRKAASGNGGATGEVTDQPHNQTLLVAIQLGLVGAALLFAMWISHLMLFRGSGMVAWLGVGVVVQNIVACLFNSYLFEFTLGWVYIFGVGVLGGMMLRYREAAKALDSEVAPEVKGR
jgi:O-antigen ligase